MLLLATSVLALLRPAFSQNNAPMVSPVGPTPQGNFIPQNSVFGSSAHEVPGGSNPIGNVLSPLSGFGSSARVVPTGPNPLRNGIGSFLLASPVGPSPQQANFVQQNSVVGSSAHEVPGGSNPIGNVLSPLSGFGSSARVVPTGPNPLRNGIGNSLLASPVGPTPQVNFVPQNGVFGSSDRLVPSGPNPVTSPGSGPGIGNSLLASPVSLTPQANFVLQNNVFGSSQIGSASSLPMSRVGKCIGSNINVIANANFGTITSENNGVWVYSAVPDAPENDDLYWAHLQSQPTTTPNNYLLNVYTQTQNEELQISVRFIVTDRGSGYATATFVNGNIDGFLSVKFFITDYSPGRYALFYICSDDVDDIGIDYRYLIAHGWPLSNQERAAANQKDRLNRFRGQMVML